MTATTATYSPLATYISKATLAVADPLVTVAKFGNMERLPQNNSSTMTFIRYELLAPADAYGNPNTKLLVEGEVPSEVNPVRTTLTVSVRQYGNISRVSDMAMWTNIEDVKRPVVERNAKNMVHVTELVYWASITGGTNVFRLTDDIGGVSGAARVNVAGRINAPALKKAIRNLRLADGKPITSQINATGKIGTQGIKESFIMVINPRVEYDLISIPDFIPVTSYPSQDGVYPGECGAYLNIRFVVSTLAQAVADAGAAVAGTHSTTGVNNDVFLCMLFARDAFTTLELEGSSETVFINSKDNANPLGQFATFGWKNAIGGGILNDDWLLRFECAASAN